MNLKNTDIRDIRLFNSKQKKQARFLTKRGINLAADNDAQNKRKTLLLGCAAAAVVLLALLKFGVLDQYARLDEAEAKYSQTHRQNEQVREMLEDYDEVLLEYRTYSMDWMENDDSGKYVSVSRREILDMVEEIMMTKGTVTNIQISGEYVDATMRGMDLDEISRMCAELEEVDFVESATLETASTKGKNEDGTTEDLLFQISIHLQRKSAAPAEKEG